MYTEMFTYFILYFYCQTMSCLALSEWNTVRVQSVFPDDSVSASDTAATGLLSSLAGPHLALSRLSEGRVGVPVPVPRPHPC